MIDPIEVRKSVTEDVLAGTEGDDLNLYADVSLCVCVCVCMCVIVCVFV